MRSRVHSASTDDTPTRRPFTVVVCTMCTLGSPLAVLEALRETIRRCDHGVLITSACTLAIRAGAVHDHCRGVTVVVQPCSIHRAPRGPARWVGPIENHAELRAVCAWLERGRWDLPVLGSVPREGRMGPLGSAADHAQAADDEQ